MKRGETVFDYVKQIFTIFGFMVLCLNIFCILFGEEAKGVGTIFALGKSGLSTATMLQFFLVAVIISTLDFLLFTDGLIKKRIPVAVRLLIVFVLIILVMSGFIIWFGWFPSDIWQPWALFFVCFGVCAGGSILISSWREKSENKKMEEALQRLKESEP